MALTRPTANQIVSSTIDFTDPLMRINKGQSGVNDKDIGIVFERGSDTNVAFIWDESADQFAVINTNEIGTTSGNVSIDSYANFRANTVTLDSLTLDSQLTIGSQQFIAQGTNGFSVNEDFDPSNSATQTAYHFTSGSGRSELAFTLARTAAFTNGFGIYGDASDNKFVLFGEQSNTGWEWRTGVGIRPLDLDGGTLRLSLSSAGALRINNAYTLPTADGTSGQVLSTNGSGTLSFVSVTASPAGSNTQVQFNNNGSLGASANLTFNGTTLTSTAFSGPLTGNVTGNASTATSATNATNFDVEADNTTNATHYVIFTGGATGNQRPNSDTDLTYNPSTNTLTTTNFAGQATTAKYADLAENYLADQQYPVGTVLQIGGIAEVTVAIEKNYGVVGTVSDKPGYLMNSDLEGEYVTPVAYIGRVPCRVKGTVRRGELLVVSDTPGVAITKDPRDILPGQLVGKALQEYTNNGEGVIEILVGRL